MAVEQKTVFENESSMAVKSAFELIGRVAVLEIMTKSDVNTAISGFEKYFDKEKLEAVNLTAVGG